MKRHLLSLIAFILGFTGVCMAAFQNNIHAKISPAQEEETGWKKKAGQAVRKLVEEKLPAMQAPPPAAPPADATQLPLTPWQMGYTLAGLLAMGLGAFAWSLRQNVRLSGAAVALGVVAVAWQWALIGVMIAVAIFLLANFSP